MKAWHVVIAFVFVVAVLFLSHRYLMHQFGEYEERGQFGDMFGFANAMFSGLAFGGVVYALYIQSRDSEEQKFQTVFFQLLQLNSDIVKSLDFVGKNGTRTGHDVFRTYYNHFEKRCRRKPVLKDFNVDALVVSPPSDISLETTLACYNEIFIKRQSDLGHYYRNLYHTYRFLDESKIRDKDKYSRFLRAQFSSYELVFLFYNGLSVYGKENFYPLMCKYKTVANLDWDLLISEGHKDEYPPEVYK